MTLSRRLQVVVAAVESGVLPLFYTPDPSSDADPAALGPAVANLIALVAAARADGPRRPA